MKYKKRKLSQIVGISQSYIQDYSPLLVKQVQRKLTRANSRIPNDGKVNGVLAPLQDCRETPVLRLIPEVTMESNKKYSDKEGTDPRDLSRAREGSSDRAFLANRRIVSNRPESRYENVTEKIVDTQLNRSLIAKITLDFSTKSHSSNSQSE